MSALKTYELLGRWAESPNVRVQAASAEEAVDVALELGYRVRPGYFMGGALIPVEVKDRSDDD